MNNVDKIYHEFCKAIFKKTFYQIDWEQKTFVRQHIGEWEKYRDAIFQQVFPHMAKKPNGKDYWMVREWYYKRIPLRVVQAAIEYVVNYAKSEGKAIFSMKYFDGQVRARFDKYCKKDRPDDYYRMMNIRLDEYDDDEDYPPDYLDEFKGLNKNDPWLYDFYRLWQSGKHWISEYDRFDFFEGVNNYKGVCKDGLYPPGEQTR